MAFDLWMSDAAALLISAGQPDVSRCDGIAWHSRTVATLQRHQQQVLAMVGFVEQVVEVVASVMVGRKAVEHGSCLVEVLDCVGRCSYADSFFSVVGSLVVLVASTRTAAKRAFAVSVIEDLVRS